MIKIKLSRLILFSLILINFGCSENQIKAPVYLGEMENFNFDQKFEILSILQDLNRKLDNSLFTFNKNNKPKINLDFTEKTIKKQKGGLAGTALILINSCKITIYPVSFNDRILKTVLWHEVGHCFGLEHSKNPNDIMYTSVGQFENYSQDSINSFLQDLKKSSK